MSAKTKTNFTFTIDTETKSQFDTLCKQIGIPKSAAIIGMIKQAVRTQSMSFSLYDENGFTASEANTIQSRIADMDSGKFVSHELIED